MKKLIFIFVTIFVASNVFATVINVPDDYYTIQTGIDAATEGDTVLVQSGTYEERLNFNSKNITVASQYLTTNDTTYISQTIIDGNGAGSVIIINSGEDTSAVLTGFTVTGGSTNYSGGGIFCYQSSPTLKNLIITNNSSQNSGGGITFYTSGAILKDTKISGNSTDNNGGGIHCRNNSSLSLNDVSIKNNTAEASGGGIHCSGSYLGIENASISGNSCDDYGGGIRFKGSDGYLNNTTLKNNSSVYGGAISCYNSSLNLTNIYLQNNNASDDGGGIHCLYNTSINLSNSIITGNTATDNGGGLVLSSSSSSFQLDDVLLNDNSADCGGGIYFYDNNSTNIENVTVKNNSAFSKGGGIYCSQSSPDFSFDNRCNIYTNTITSNKGNGADIYSSDTITVVVDTFTVINPTDQYASPLANFSFDILHGFVDSLVNADLYVAVDGDNSNSGLSPAQPLKTITHAQSVIYADSSNINTIHLAPGVYSDSTNGESYPLNWSSYVNLSGSNREETILDANQTGRVMVFLNSTDCAISNLTIRQGYASGNVYEERGGGILCDNSDPHLEQLIVTENYAESRGGGIYFKNYACPSIEDVVISNNISEKTGGGVGCYYNSSPVLNNVTITGNSAFASGGGISCGWSASCLLQNVNITENTTGYRGGGLLCLDSHLTLENVDITDNSAGDNGGGISVYEDSDLLLDNVVVANNNSGGSGGGISSVNNDTISFSHVSIRENNAVSKGGGLFCEQSYPEFSYSNRCNIYENTIGSSKGAGADIFSFNPLDVIVDTFTVINPTDYYASPLDNFTFDIIHCTEDSLINADLYVSVDGDNSNSGLTPAQPLKTINHALSLIFTDSLNVNTIHLAPGVYSSSTNGESFPLKWSNCINLDGYGEAETILDANQNARVLELIDVNICSINNITIRNGYAQGSNNPANRGGGIYCYNSSPMLENITITNNYADKRGGGIYCYETSSPILNQITLANNTADFDGGAIYCSDNSSPCLENVVITGNYAGSEGGGICCWHNSCPSLNNVELTFNSTGGSGGAIYFWDCSPTLTNVTIINNNSSERGGGIYLTGANPNLYQINISENSAGNCGGGICCSNCSTPTLEHVVISENNANISGGGVFCYISSSPVFENVTITSNNANYNGGGICCSYNSSPSFVNCIVSDNTGNYGIYNYTSTPGDPEITYSDFFNNENGNFYNCDSDLGVEVSINANGDPCDLFYNIQMDPLFLNASAGDYHLTANSPCIDAGDSTSPLDPDSTIADMGAYYYNQNQAVDDEHEYITEHGFICFPNPITTTTNKLNISFSLKKPSKVNIKLYNIKGQMVTQILNDNRHSGVNTISSNINNLASGIYFIKMDVDGKNRAVKKMVKIE